jgi:predicted O-methyltransferase YrrM
MTNRRIFNYRKSLIPNRFVSSQEVDVWDIFDAKDKTGLSMGYPSWNLLYYSLLCHLTRPITAVVIETGTNLGFSTIMLAQVLKDLESLSRVITIDIDKDLLKKAAANVAQAGLSDYVDFRHGDSTEVLEDLVSENKIYRCMDFVLLDGSHRAEDVFEEFSIIHESVSAAKGMVFFDNTALGGVADALDRIKKAFGGNLIQFYNCSWSPNGNAIWSP